jgi:hypothetical protein
MSSIKRLRSAVKTVPHVLRKSDGELSPRESLILTETVEKLQKIFPDMTREDVLQKLLHERKRRQGNDTVEFLGGKKKRKTSKKSKGKKKRTKRKTSYRKRSARKSRIKRSKRKH